MLEQRLESEQSGGSKPYLEYKWNDVLCRAELEHERVCSIGRNRTNNIVLSEAATVSLRHASVQSIDRRFYLTDLNSRNGTMLNGRPVKAPTPLNDGDVIKVGGCELVFHDEGLSSVVVASQVESLKTRLLVSRQLITVLVADIKGYTGLTLKLGEARMSQIVGTLFEKAGGILNANDAWSQKYIGDAVMGIWLHDHETPTAEELHRVFRSLVELKSTFTALNNELRLPLPITFGAAVNTGYAAIGNLGSKALPDHTAVGDTVNLAFRLETATRGMDAEIILGKLTYSFVSMLGHPTDGMEPHMLPLKGYPRPEEAYATNFATIVRMLESQKATR